MKIISLLGFFIATLSASAQFYAPEVYYHDAAQRLFVVEAARVHAWIANQSGAGIASVSWEADSDFTGDTAWQLMWKDAAGAVLRTQEVRYGKKELNSGADFYRPVWRQIHGIATDKPLPETPAVDASMQAYWTATQHIGTSRMKGVSAIDTFVHEHAPQANAADAAAFSSMLIHTTMPILAGSCTLDYSLLARGAAWLCHAEDLTGSRLRTAWPPLFYLAGREKLAGDRWQEYFKPDSKDGVAAQWWECMLRKRPALLRDVVLFAAEPEHAGWGLPFMAAHLRLDGAHDGELANIINMLYGKKLQTWPDMAPLFSREIGMSPLRPFIGQAPFIARLNWLRGLEQVTEHATAEAARARMPAIKEALSQLEAETSNDLGARGLQGAADLINAGYALPPRETLLAPVAGITADDLIVHGWDQTVDHMSAWYKFLNNVWGVAELAVPLEQACNKAVPTLAYWVRKGKTTAPSEVEVAPQRVEFFDNYYLFHPAFAVPAEAQARSPLRNWLKRSSLGQSHLWTLSHRAPQDFNIWPHLDALLAQGGEDACSRCYDFLNKEVRPEDRESHQKAAPQRYELARSGCPNAIELHRLVANLEKPGAEPDHFAIGLAVERLYWEAPSVSNTSTIMDRYIMANAMESAKRFYSQSLAIAGNTISFSNGIPQRRWIIAWMEDDREAMDEAARDAPSYSYRDMAKHLMHALAIGEDTQALRIAQGMLQRYPSTSSGKVSEMVLWRDFLPLLPALADPKHAQRAEALAYFHGDKNSSMPWLRFILARRFKLSVADAVKWIDDENPTPERSALIAYLRKDETAFATAYARVKRAPSSEITDTGRTLIECLRHEMLKIAPVPDQPDIRPAKVELLDELVRQKLAR